MTYKEWKDGWLKPTPKPVSGPENAVQYLDKRTLEAILASRHQAAFAQEAFYALSDSLQRSVLGSQPAKGFEESKTPAPISWGALLELGESQLGHLSKAKTDRFSVVRNCLRAVGREPVSISYHTEGRVDDGAVRLALYVHFSQLPVIVVGLPFHPPGECHHELENEKTCRLVATTVDLMLGFNLRRGTIVNHAWACDTDAEAIGCMRCQVCGRRATTSSAAFEPACCSVDDNGGVLVLASEVVQ